ncbi:hypothetical protein [Streptomyces sp. T028]|uniref:hypothetical protein n=1 Tax=Streptomyces sp. T028 TaxID=3394379 RepID=UPI003A85CC69
MKSFRATAAASALACIAFAGFMGAVHTVSAPTPEAATHSVLAGTEDTDDDSGWGRRSTDVVVTAAGGISTDGDSGWGRVGG